MENTECFIAFLRGVNVNGTTMKMAEVCKVFVNAGCSDVTSVLATGNIIFKSSLTQEKLKEKLESALSENFNYEAFLFIKKTEEVQKILEEKPFAKDVDFNVYAFITLPKFENVLLEEFSLTEKTAGEEAQIKDQYFYWKVKKGLTLDSNFGKILGRKSFKNAFTSRNINTIEKICAKL